jgi:hypothetical protein
LVGFVAALLLCGPDYPLQAIAGAVGGGLVGALLGFFLTRGLVTKPK